MLKIGKIGEKMWVIGLTGMAACIVGCLPFLFLEDLHFMVLTGFFVVYAVSVSVMITGMMICMWTD